MTNSKLLVVTENNNTVHYFTKESSPVMMRLHQEIACASSGGTSWAAVQERFPKKFLEEFDIIETQALAISDRDLEVLVHQIEDCDAEPGDTPYDVLKEKYPELNEYIDYLFQKQQRTWTENDGFETSFVSAVSSETID